MITKGSRERQLVACSDEGLTLLATHEFTSVADPLPLVGLGGPYLSDVCRELADCLFVTAPDNDLCRARDVTGNPVWHGQLDRVRETHIEIQDVTVKKSLVAHPLDIQLSLERLGHADHHVVDQASRESVQCAMLPLVIGTGYPQFPGLLVMLD